VIVGGVLQTFRYRFDVMEIIVFLSGTVNTDVDILVTWIRNERTIVPIAYTWAIYISFMDSYK